jgi:hypothetical protein
MVANTNGGRDNTTVIVVDVLDDISEPIASSAPDNTSPMQLLLRRQQNQVHISFARSILALLICLANGLMHQSY